MSARKSNLFEVIRPRDKDEPSPTQTPGWWNNQSSTDEPAHARGKPQTGGTSVAMAWLGESSRWSMPRAMWLVLIVGAIAVPILAYRMGARQQPPADLSAAGQRSQQKMAELRRTNVDSMLLSQVHTTSGAGVSHAAAKQPPIVKNGDRVPGLNYYCLETMPARYRSEAERAATFLRRNGVDVAIVGGNNGRIRLIALKGFEKPYSDPRAEEYQNLLRSLGRAWKLEHRGWSDWSDTYPEKYTGG